MPTNCKIYFNTNNNVLYSGQKIVVTVRLILTEEIKLRSITIQLRGKTKVHFMKDDRKIEGKYVASENLLDVNKCLEDGNDGEILHKLPGTYDYSFQFVLPPNLPSTFHDWYGETKYSAQVTINIPLWPDKTFKRKFYIVKSVDLNDFPSLRDAVTVEKEVTKELRKPAGRCFESYPGGPFKILVRTNAGGYVPGQYINVDFEITNNDHHHAILHSHIRLLQRIIFSKSESSKHQRTKFRSLDDKSWNGCPINEHKKFNVRLLVPNVQPTDNESKLIKIDYVLHINCKMWYNQTFSEIFPIITIGSEQKNIPEHNTFSPLPTEPSSSRFVRPSAPLDDDIVSISTYMSSLPDDDTVSIRTYASTPPPFPDDDFDLPTYDQAMLLSLDDEFDLDLDSIP